MREVLKLHLESGSDGSEPSFRRTQHSNERLVKISSRMARTGKIEQIANYYLIAANGFIKECHDESNLEQDDEDDTDDDTAGNTFTRKGGISKGIVKLVHNEQHQMRLEREYTKIQQQITFEEFREEENLVCKKLNNADIIKREKDTQAKDTMMETFEETKTNFRVNLVRPRYVLPVFNGYILYKKLICKKQLDLG